MDDLSLGTKCGLTKSDFEELGLVSDQHDESKGKTISGSSSIVHEVAIGAMRAFGSKEGETTKNLLIPFIASSSQFKVPWRLTLILFPRRLGFP
ncbi:hypothetical protein PVL29_021815 [Vitis rotundifolia]|uniref:Uncharacterized protein n=1 Tax=Vitis rotundifolia TaxID=103349 RepID=A0AA39DAA3_VITRO|nr:hypothetical protein PVL29_021815 [Vitis rotundifolia]